jgi:hypothetical protein
MPAPTATKATAANRDFFKFDFMSAPHSIAVFMKRLFSP